MQSFKKSNKYSPNIVQLQWSISQEILEQYWTGLDDKMWTDITQVGLWSKQWYDIAGNE